MVPECFRYFSISLYFPKGSNLKPKFDKGIDRLNQAGLINKWKEDEMDKLSKSLEVLSSSNLDKKALETKDVLVAFVIAGIGAALSLLAFVAEYLCGCFCHHAS